MAPATTLRYQPALMGFRAVAIGLVVLGHWNWPLFSFPLNELGLQPLIVLSGYLISGIIWQSSLPGDGAAGWPRRLGVFYGRRFLRIFPAYYLSLALGALLPLATLHQYPGWFLLPLANLLCYRLQAWPEGVGHYWTTALEVQFYLAWPFVLGLVRQRAAGLWALVVLGVAYRCYQAFYLVPAAPVFATVLFPSCLDLFALGALAQLHQRLSRPQRRYPGWPAALALAAWLLLWAALPTLPASGRLWAVLSPSIGAVASYFVLRWLRYAPPAAGWLAHPVAQWVGERSYGIYLYHLMLPVLYQRVVFHFTTSALAWRTWLMHPLLMTLLLLPVLLGLSAASWRYLEAPLARFKARELR